MKVLHLHLGNDGGTERFFLHLVNALSIRSVQQKFVIRPKRTWRREIEGAGEITESYFRDASIDRFLLPRRVVRMINAWQPDALIAWMPRACRLIPKVANCLRIARLGDYPPSLEKYKHVDVLVCNAPGIVDHVRSLGWARRTEVITNFTRTERVQPVSREQLGTPRDAKVITSVGRFVELKGFDILIQAVARMPHTFLWLVGDGEQRESLGALARRLGAEQRIRFLGWQSDPRPYVAASDVFALASRHETLGNVILEAWAQQVPVVSTRSEGPSWYMRTGENGLLVDMDDVAGFQRSFDQIFQQPELARTLIAGGEATLSDMFTEEAIVSAYMQLIASGRWSQPKEERAA